MRESAPTPQINMSKMPVGSGIAGGIFTLAIMTICLFGIPALRYFLLAAIVLGGALAPIIKSVKHETPGKAWIPSDTRK